MRTSSLTTLWLCYGCYLVVKLTAIQTWANEVNNGNAEERALTISSMNRLFYATSESNLRGNRPFPRQLTNDVDSYLPILIFPQTMAPTFERGFPSILSFALAAVILVRKFPHFNDPQVRPSGQTDREPFQSLRISCTSISCDKKQKLLANKLLPKLSWREK
ncbi:hypothetical protein CPAR01_02050 [Colletotrichum paranaense]|uniref:Secreted protein n=1 Tax=Colletotrichum paranaense TaxID=1914294 RepID=A0ABQ9SYF0_9PEZI|nr:uncharacterized protein CPAR01_02050 [Colletotrichum paranaense]KAK1544548.1 hypothetical protein CPAR01_02050 [Colletotrichum paranaense]